MRLLRRHEDKDVSALTVRKRAPSWRSLGGLVALLLLVIGVVVSAGDLRAQGSPTVCVAPTQGSPCGGGMLQPYYKPTPITFVVQASNLSGSGQGDAAGYQYALTWNPNFLTWLSGPIVGAGTPTPAPVLPCSNSPQIITWGTQTATPIGFVPTFTPTNTPTPTPTNTPGAGTPTNSPTNTFTPSPTFTPTITPTPGGFIFVGCASIFGTAVPGGTLGTFAFQPNPNLTSQVSLGFNLMQVALVDHNGTPVPVTPISGHIVLGACNDLNGDGVVNALDLNILGKAFLQTVPPAAAKLDLNHDGLINALDLNILGQTFLMAC